jgi:hypothetical protein
METNSKEKSEERLPEAETWERERASKGRGKRELQTIEMETYENENTEIGPWVIICNFFVYFYVLSQFID